MDYEQEKKQFRTYFIALMLSGSFALGVFWGRGSVGASLPLTGNSEGNLGSFEELRKLRDIIGEKYVNQVPSKEALLDGAAKGMVGALGDPYTVFWNKDETTEFSEEMEGSFEGIGAEIGIRDKILTVIAPLDGMPAEKAGIKSGDKILKINDELTNEMGVSEAVKKIRGPKGTEVKLLIMRDNVADSFEVKVARDKIDIKSVTWEKKDGGIAYLRVSGFLKNTSSEFAVVSQEILTSNSRAVVLDLRDNPGGYLETAVDLAGYFLPKGKLVVTEDHGAKNKEKNREHFTYGDGQLVNYPVIILVNQGSASASEILAGAIRDQKGAKLLGKKTYGKGSVQEVADLDAGKTLKVTVAKWLLPNGANIDKEGLAPDIEIERNTEEELKTAQEGGKGLGDGLQQAATSEAGRRDGQLERALELLRLGN
jgi:carboxyl-terminal processing protease